MPKTILIIEDEETLAKAIRRYLDKKEEYIIDWASDGITGFEKAEQADLILLDIVLPGKNGFQVLDRIRSTESTKSKKVIVLTNVDSESDRQAAEKLGAADYLVKATTKLARVCEIIELHMGEPESNPVELPLAA